MKKPITSSQQIKLTSPCADNKRSKFDSTSGTERRVVVTKKKKQKIAKINNNHFKDLENINPQPLKAKIPSSINQMKIKPPTMLSNHMKST